MAAIDGQSLERDLKNLNAELANAQREREKQQQLLEQLHKEKEGLKQQSDSICKRNQLIQQIRDVEETTKFKLDEKRRVQGELEQGNLQLKQLRRTLALMQGAVQTILEKSQSAQDVGDSSVEGEDPESVRARLIEQIMPQNWRMIPGIGVPHKNSGEKLSSDSAAALLLNEDDASEDEEINEDQDEIVSSLLSPMIQSTRLSPKTTTNVSGSRGTPSSRSSHGSKRSIRAEVSQSRSSRTSGTSSKSDRCQPKERDGSGRPPISGHSEPLPTRPHSKSRPPQSSQARSRSRSTERDDFLSPASRKTETSAISSDRSPLTFPPTPATSSTGNSKPNATHTSGGKHSGKHSSGVTNSNEDGRGRRIESLSHHKSSKHKKGKPRSNSKPGRKKRQASSGQGNNSSDNKANEDGPTAGDDAAPPLRSMGVRQQSLLMAMLENGEVSERSIDTPKTTNTSEEL